MKFLLPGFLLLLLSLPASAQVVVSGNVQDIGVANVTSGMQVTFELQNYAGAIPRVPGGPVIGRVLKGFNTDTSGNFTGSLYPNSVIEPQGTWYRVCVVNLGQELRCNKYLINGPFNLSTAVPITPSTNIGPNQFITESFPFTQLTPATTWTVTHNFNDANTIVYVAGLTGSQIFPDDTNCRTNRNVCTLTFVTPTTGFAIAMHAAAINIANNQPNAVIQNATAPQVVAGSLTLTGPLTALNINNTISWDGVSAASLQSAINLACNGTVPGRLELPPAGVVPMNATVTVGAGNSNCTINGAGKDRVVLQASASFNTPPVLQIINTSKVRLSGFGVDGNRANNSNVLDCINVNSSTDVVIDGIRASNCTNHGIAIVGSSSNVTVPNYEVFGNGSATVTATGTGGITVAPSGSPAMSHITIGPNGYSHGNNTGINVFNSSDPTKPLDGVNLFENYISGNVNDAILVSAFQPSGGKITGIAEGNIISCNGWPANANGFSPKCTPEGFQAGSVSSGNGVGIDLIQNGDQLLSGFIVSNNWIRDNVFEGIATASQIFSTVNTNGTAVTWIAGTSVFKTSWRAGQVVTINTIPFKIASVADTTHLTLASSAGVQNGVGFAGPSYMRASITGNHLIRNGNALQAVGPGSFCFMSDGNTYGQNVAENNNLEGFEDDFCSFTTHSGDLAFSNDTSATANRNKGFASYGSLSNSYWGVVADDPTASPTQTVGLDMDSLSTNTLVFSTGLFGTSNPVTGVGVAGNIYVNSSPNIPGNLQINGGGNGISFGHSGVTAIVPESAGGNFTATLKAVTAPLSNTIVSGTSTLGSSSIAATTCNSVVTTSATLALATDAITWSYATAPSSSTDAKLVLSAYPTANNVNFILCNPTAGALVPTGLVVNWSVRR